MTSRSSIICAVLLAASGYAFQQRQPFRMPDLVGHPIDEVRLRYGQQSAERGLWFKIATKEDYSCKAVSGVVTNQSPQAGTLVENGEPVTLWVAAACVTVPDVVKRPVEEALRMLESAKLGFKTTTTSAAGVRPNTVLAQFPQPRSQVPPGTPVQLTIAGPPPVPTPTVSPVPTPRASPVPTPSPPVVRMPNLVGQSLAEARRNPDLEAIRALIETESDPNSGFRPGIVATQSPAPGTVLGPAVRVTLGVATSSPQPGLLMPNLVGRGLEQAKSDPEVLRLGLRIGSEDDYSSTLEPGVVTKQSIQAGTGIKGGDTVMLSVAARQPAGATSGVAPWIIGLLAAAGLGYFIFRLAKKRPMPSPATPCGSSFPEVRVRSMMGSPEQHVAMADGLVSGPELRVRARPDRGIQGLQGNLLVEEGRGERS